jgi:hypothetical protein
MVRVKNIKTTIVRLTMVRMTFVYMAIVRIKIVRMTIGGMQNLSIAILNSYIANVTLPIVILLRMNILQ